VTASCDLVKKVNNLLADVLVEYKYLGNWRQIVSLNNQDLCYYLSLANNLGYLYLATELSNGFVHMCPFQISRLEIVNLTNFDVFESFLGSEPSVIEYVSVNEEASMKKYFFKGDLRGSLTLKTKADPKGVKISGIYTISGRKLDTF